MMPPNKNNPPATKVLPSESSLRILLANGMDEAVQQVLDTNPELKFKIEKDPTSGKSILVDSVTGAALWLKRFITNDADTIAMKQDAMKLSKIDDEVLITGETGVGKEIIARAMIGDREGSFARINCAAMPKELIEAELFGYVKGAFTGADSTRKGLLVSADKGVMFLDEIGDLDISVQGKLLNVLQPIDGKRYVRPVGGTDEKEITCRFVFATHRDIKTMVNDGKFRKDLYARISTFELHIKPLRERVDDIEPIVLAIGEQLKILPKAKEFLQKHMNDMLNGDIDLSLNVRSIERTLKRYNILGRV